MRKLKAYIIEGWPQNKNHLNGELKLFHGIKDELVVEDDIILRG